MITQELLNRILIYEPLTGILRWRYRPEFNKTWNTRMVGRVAGARKSRNGRSSEIQVSVTVGGEQRLYRSHCLIWCMVTGVMPDVLIDHADGDPYNNRWVNLRKGNNSTNAMNRHLVAGSVPYKGVHFISRLNKFAAQIKKSGKCKWLGTYVSAEDAALAYDLECECLHGEFAVTNKSLGLLGESDEVTILRFA